MSTIRELTTRRFLGRADEPKPHPIPPMTHPLSQAWDQPALSNFIVDDEIAVMTQHTLDQLREYSMSIPTGAYEGKIWKRNELHDRHTPEDRWFLCWYGPCDTPGHVQVNERLVSIVLPEEMP